MATAVACILAYFASGAISGYVVFSPFRFQLQANPIHRGKFQISDLLAVFIPIQIGLASLNTLFADVKWYPVLAILVGTAFSIAVSLAWLYGLRLLARINVNNAAKRVLFLGVVVPLGFTLSATSFLIVVLAASIPQSLVRLLLIVTILLGLRWLGLWVLSEKTPSLITPAEQGCGNQEMDRSPPRAVS